MGIVFSYQVLPKPLAKEIDIFREAGKSKDWLLEKIESTANGNIASEYINNWIQTPSTIKVIDEQIKTK